jgi:L-alanine-DL-glutamate epimerase-like enolase superfamily enzyme
MEITDVYAIPFQLPLRHEIRWANGAISSADHVLVVVETKDGVRGFAEAIPRPMTYGETTESILAAIDTFVRPALIGRSILDRGAIAHALRNVVYNNTTFGAVDTAIWDAIGKSLGVSVHQLLGGYTDRVAVSAVLGDGNPPELVNEALGFSAEHGIRSFKIKVGWDVRRDANLVLELRKSLPDAHLCVDANHGFSATEALEFLRITRDAGLAWIEEPSPAEDRHGRARVAAHAEVGILGDESCRDAAEVAREVLSGRSSMVSIKIARTGISGSERIRGFCEANQTAMVIGNQGDSAIGTWASIAFAAANPSTAMYPTEMAYFLHIADDIANRPQINDGYLTVPREPGFGFAIDFDQLARYAVNPDLVKPIR